MHFMSRAITWAKGTWANCLRQNLALLKLLINRDLARETTREGKIGNISFCPPETVENKELKTRAKGLPLRGTVGHCPRPSPRPPAQADRGRKLERFRDTASRQANIILCVPCGSANIDQNSLHELHCYDCGNRLPWDGLVFTIARTRGVDLEDDRCTTAVDDAERAFKLRERTPPWVAADEVEEDREVTGEDGLQ